MWDSGEALHCQCIACPVPIFASLHAPPVQFQTRAAAAFEPWLSLSACIIVPPCLDCFPRLRPLPALTPSGGPCITAALSLL